MFKCLMGILTGHLNFLFSVVGLQTIIVNISVKQHLNCDFTKTQRQIDWSPEQTPHHGLIYSCKFMATVLS